MRSPSLLLRDHAVLIRVSPGYPPLKGRSLRIPHPSATRYCYLVRLACVRHTASVQSEPGSNSPINLKLTGMPRSAEALFKAIERSMGSYCFHRCSVMHWLAAKHPEAPTKITCYSVKDQASGLPRLASGPSAGRRIIEDFHPLSTLSDEPRKRRLLLPSQPPQRWPLRGGEL